MDSPVIGASFPGEQVVVAILRYAEVARQTMSQENRDGWDALNLKVSRDAYAVWRDIWVKAKVLPAGEEKH